jgi:predicted PurR-regulated permease PerM
MDRERIIALFFFGLLALISYELYAVLYAFITPILWATLLAFLIHPAQVWLHQRIKSRSTCALLLTAILALGVLGPAAWLSTTLVREAQALYKELPQAAAHGASVNPTSWLSSTTYGLRFEELLARHGVKLDDQMHAMAIEGIRSTSEYVMKHAGTVAGNIVTDLIDFSMAMIAFFYLVRDGESYYTEIRDLTPLHPDAKAAVFDTLRSTLSAVMRGLLLTAALDGVVLGLAYLVLDVPYWGLLAVLSAAGGLIPVIGSAVAWVPVAVYVFFTAGWGHALVLVVWAAATLAVIDNFIKPLAMGHGAGLPTVALLFALAGGIEAYGPLGIFLGPAVIAVFVALLRVYQQVYFPEASPEPETLPMDVPRARTLRQRLRRQS